jgi:outer membrane protein, heavy metal efflux system
VVNLVILRCSIIGAFECAIPDYDRFGKIARDKIPKKSLRGLCQIVRCLWLILAASAAAGCTHYEPAPIEPRQSVEQFASRQLTDPQLRDDVSRLMPRAEAQWPPQAWDRAQLFAVAVVRNPELAVAHAKIKAALAHEVTAAEIPNPNLTLQSEYARHDPYAWLYGVGVSWLLPTPNRRRLEREGARIETLSARLQLMEKTWGVRYALVTALSDLQAAHRRLELLQHLAELQGRLVGIEQQRVESGEDPPGELLVSEQEKLGTEQQLSDQQILIGEAQAEVAKAMGMPARALVDVEPQWPEWGAPPPVSEPSLKEMREQTLLSRSDLLQAINDYAVAETRLHLAVVRQYPQFTLQPGFYWDHGIAKFPFDIGFDVPFNGNRGEIAEARAGREVAGQQMLAVQAGIYGEIAEAVRLEEIARGGAEVAERRLQSTRKREEQLQLAMRVGASDAVEQTTAQILVTQAELDLLQSRQQLQSARNALENVLRAPLSGPELSLGGA